MPKPVNKVGAYKDALLQVGASFIRSRRSIKHIDKLDDEEALSLINEIARKQTKLQKHLENGLKAEIRRVNNLVRVG